MNPFSEAFMNSPQGQAAMAYAESVYSSLFIGGEFTVQSEPSMFDELVCYHVEPKYQYCDCPRHMECDCEPVEILPGMDHDAAVKLVESSVYVWLCNYKGEEDGPAFALKSECSGLRTYHGKWNYS